MSKFFYIKSNGDMLDGHIDLTVPFYIKIKGETKAVTHKEWMKHNNLTMKDNSLFDLEIKKMFLRIAKLNYSFDLNNKYYQQEFEKAKQEFEKAKNDVKVQKDK